VLDLGRSLIATAERSPAAAAIVDGARRVSYQDWLAEIAAAAAGLGRLGLRHGDHLVLVLQNRMELATLHWACQLAGIIATPLNWRAKTEEVDYCLADAAAKAVAFEPVSAAAVSGAAQATHIPRIGVGGAEATVSFAALIAAGPADATPCAGPEDVSLMLYTSGTTGRPKGVPRRHRAERAAALAHVAQNLYARGERTLGVMPLYHTMGVRSLLAMALIDGCFVCQRRFDAGEALGLIARERVTTLYLVPTLYHDLLAQEKFAAADLASCKKLGYAGAAMPDGLARRVVAGFKPDLFVNHYGSSEIYTFTVEQNAAAKPGSAGKAGLNERIRVVALGGTDPDARVAPGVEGQIIAELTSDEAFEGYWRRPDADERALHGGWYFTGDTGYFDADGDLFVTGRVDDLIITGGENVSPGEIESVLSLHPDIAEVAVAGLPDERLGHKVTAFVKRRGAIAAAALDAHCRGSALADFKRPRDYVFVAEIPKSPVGKILRRLLVAGAYETEKETGD
jgi:2-furoate---CoA ligase